MDWDTAWLQTPSFELCACVLCEPLEPQVLPPFVAEHMETEFLDGFLSEEACPCLALQILVGGSFM